MQWQVNKNSYVFRPKRIGHKGFWQCVYYLKEGYKYAVDLDLEQFSDTVNQSKLIEVLSSTIKVGRVVSPIHRYLQGGVMIAGRLELFTAGLPHGDPWSPLLSNILLNELGRELETRCHRFVRYADDLIILFKSERSAMRTMTSIVKYVQEI